MNTTKTIILIDDDEVSNMINVNILKGIINEDKILYFKNATEALKHLVECDKTDNCPKLILLDIDMPVINGFEFIDKMKNSSFNHAQDIPIVLLSNSEHPKDIMQSRKAGIEDYLLKPLNKDVILELMRKYDLGKSI